MRTYKTEGIILKRTNFAEADRILTVFTKHYGKIKVLARGVRKITSRRGPNVELFNWVTLFLVKGRNFDIVTEAEVKDSFPALRKNLETIGLAYHICELIDNLCPERQENKEVFNLSTELLSDLNSRKVRQFEVNLLATLGFWPKGSQIPETYIEDLIEKKLKARRFFNLI